MQSILGLGFKAPESCLWGCDPRAVACSGSFRVGEKILNYKL